MKCWQVPLAILATLSTSITFAEDFKTISGKEYKDAKITLVEPDGITLKTKSGISKVYFIELSKEVQEKFHYKPAAAAAFNTAAREAIAKSNDDVQKEAAAKEKAANAQQGKGSTGNASITGRARSSLQKAVGERN